MIRLFEEEDLDEVLAIWLDANLRAHSFIPAGYWEGRREEVRQALPQAELYVWEERGEILGFLGLEGDYIAGIFVRHGAQSRGVGKKLLDRAKEGRGRLSLCLPASLGAQVEANCDPEQLSAALYAAGGVPLEAFLAETACAGSAPLTAIERSHL